MKDTYRLPHLDALRGFALMGIVVVNYQVFASGFMGTGISDPAFSRPWDLAVLDVIALLFETKFYLLFSFLFGYSFTLQMESAARDGADSVPRLRRRMLALMVLGLVHALLFYHGDILLAYGVLGLLLLRWRNWSPQGALRMALALIAVSACFWLFLASVAPTDVWPADAIAERSQEVIASMAAYRGSIAEVIAQHWHDLRTETWGVIFYVQGPNALAMFLAGMALGKRQALAQARPAVLRGLLWLALPVGLAGAVLYMLAMEPSAAPRWTLAGLGLGLLTAPLLSLGYGGGFLLLCRRWPALQAALAPAGRMALTNYLMQSLIGALVFTGWGLGLTGRVSPGFTLGVAVLVYVLQLPLSAWWLSRYRYGPVEWLLRAVTLARKP